MSAEAMKNGAPAHEVPRLRRQRVSHRVRLWVVVAAAVTTSACQTTRYVRVPCIAADQKIPDAPAKVGNQLTGQADKDTRVLAAGLMRWQAYGVGLRDIVESCR